MATIANLCESEQLIWLDALNGSSSLPQRYFYASPELIRWVDEELPDHARDHDARLSPAEQFVDLLEKIQMGERLNHDADIKAISASALGIWEFKTTDLRILGWFAAYDIFIGVTANMKKVMKQQRLSRPMKEAVLRFRESLPLDEPKHLQSTRVEDVLSTCHHT